MKIIQMLGLKQNIDKGLFINIYSFFFKYTFILQWCDLVYRLLVRLKDRHSLSQKEEVQRNPVIFWSNLYYLTYWLKIRILPIFPSTFPVVPFSIRSLFMESMFCFTFMLTVLIFKTFFWIGVFFTFVLIFGFTIFVSTCTGMLVLFFPVFPVSVPVSSSLLKSNIFPMFGPKSSIQIRIQTKRNKVFLSYLSKIQSDRSFSFLCFSLSRLLFWSHSLLVEFLFSYLC